MPVLRPYGERNEHLGSPRLPNDSQAKIFSFESCSVAKYIIARLQKGVEELKFKNGKPTELYLHAIDCPNCNFKANWEMIKVETKILKDLKRFIKKHHPESTESNAIFLLINYYEFAYDKMRPELLKYKQRYGELK